MVPSARVGYETLLVDPPIESIMMTLLIYEVRESLPDDFENLLSDSVEGGHQFLQRPQTEWLSGANRFSKAGERLVIATKQGWLIGVGGINVDPYLDDSAIGRVRHVYVHSHFRRAGVGRAILQDLEKNAGHHFGVLTLRTKNPEADLFYRASGFRRVHDNPLVTHQKTLG